MHHVSSHEDAGPGGEISRRGPKLGLGGKLCDDLDDPTGRCAKANGRRDMTTLRRSLPILKASVLLDGLQKRMGQWPASTHGWYRQIYGWK